MSPSAPPKFDDHHRSESTDEAGTTHHSDPHILRTIKEDEIMDETATTRHEPLNIKEEEYNIETDEDEDNKAATTKEGGTNSEIEDAKKDPQYKLHRKVAEIAAKAYRRASEQSNVLSRTKLDNIALVKFDEIQIGKFLGKGSFSNVHEITKITATDITGDDESWDGSEDDSSTHKKQTSPKAKTTIVLKNPRQLLSMNYQRSSGIDTPHYRYAIKYLKEEVRASPQKYAVGTADLVVEGMFLASLAHPNIIKVRGLPEGGVKSLAVANRTHGYFLILDRLFNTLSDEMYNEWKGGHLITVRKKYGFMTNKKDNAERNKNLAVRLKVAFDICGALQFLHTKNIIYRDLKPENLGFDVRGDIKLFDLGLVKELRPSDKDSRGNYKLSMAGTPRYMAPECGMYQPYNLSADVYSFSMLLWEIIALEKPLKDFTYTKLKNEIFIDGGRPAIKKIFNKKVKSLISSGWSQNPKNRPTIDFMYKELKNEYLRLAPDTITANEVSHKRRRSTYVAAGIRNAVSVRHLVRWNSVESSVERSDGARGK